MKRDEKMGFPWFQRKSFLPLLLAVLATDKKPDVDIGDKAKSIKSKFETGELFKDDNVQRNTEDESVFEHGIKQISLSSLSINIQRRFFLFHCRPWQAIAFNFLGN